MVHENTHLWAAEQIRSRIENRLIAETIGSNLDFYYLGAVFPDLLFYGRDPRLSRAAYFLHGEPGVPSNAFIFDVLDQVKDKPDEKTLVFIWGFLTHCAMDIVFHPVVIYFSGYAPQDDPTSQLHSEYLHLHYETIIDRHFNKGFFLENMIKPAIVKDLAIPSIRNISRRDIESCLKKQIFYFRLTHSRLYYILFKILANMGLADKRLVAGFYANLAAETKKLPRKLTYRDIISGSDMEATLEDLMEEGINMAIKMVETAYDYSAGKISKESCKITIAGHNLVTGRVGKTKKDIRFSLRT
jgi:hypothetical protein